MRFSSRLVALFLLCGAAAGCQGTLRYVPPTDEAAPEKTAYLPEKKDVVWKRLLSRLTERYFDLRQVEKESGLVNFAFDAKAIDYIDCGRLQSYIRDGAGERRYDVSAASDGASFDILGDGGRESVYWNVDMTVRVNLLAQEKGSGTKVTVNAQYEPTQKIDVVTTRLRLDPVYLDDAFLRDDLWRQRYYATPRIAFFRNHEETERRIAFVSGGRKSFPGVTLASTAQYISCVSTGRLEKELLDMAREKKNNGRSR
ncbi:MAG: hypothetical protein ABW189_02505 [Rickettsiales bacterium]